MKHFEFLPITLIGILTICSCTNNYETDLYDSGAVAEKNAKTILGDYDKNQDWNTITSGSITIKANAPLENIAKVQILTESPFFNEDAVVLNEAQAESGKTITLTYSAPKTRETLVAACVSSDGNYYIQVFNIGDKEVSFVGNSSAQARKTRAASNEAPTISTIKLAAPVKSFNARRAEQGTFTISGTTYTEWQNSGWENELMWTPTDDNTFDGGWKMDKGAIYRDIDGFAEGEQANVEAIVNDFLVKAGNDKYSVNKKRNNLRLIRTSSHFTLNNNYLFTDGKTPVTLIPIQANSTEFKQNHVYYYYYKPSDVAGMTSEEEVLFIKALPKFKAIPVERVQASANIGKFFRNKEFLLPYYGDGTPTEGVNTAQAIFPSGYKIGFLNMKHNNNDNNILNSSYGCTYGDGRLNYEVNHLKGHYLSAVDKKLGGSSEEGMAFTDPRIAVFTANNKNYLCFEDGADNTFCDMIYEVGGGTNVIEEELQPEAAAYTMCFEDRIEQADYDMNDVVLQATRVNETHIQISVIACGANDKVVLKGIENSRFLNNSEVHELFGLDNTQTFVNTEVGPKALRLNPVSESILVDKTMRIENFLKNIYLENQTTGKTIKVAKKGEPPYAVIVPVNFKYPMEHTCIKDAYTHFLEWAKNINDSDDWYLYGEAKNIFPDLFSNK